jgi:hypothetical protein
MNLVRIAGVTAEIRTESPPNKNLNLYIYSNALHRY